MTNPKLLVIVGETASGKSSLAIDMAQKINGEIISADSWQVYKGFDIGTAKASKEEQSQIPHHLIDIRNAREGFSAAFYKQLAFKAISHISSRGRMPILVGGTGLYVDSVLFDYSFLPAGNPKVRSSLQKLSIAQLITKLNAQHIDLTGIDRHNKRRLVRLLETNGHRPTNSGVMRPNTLIIGLKLPRAKLRHNIEQRVEAMFRRGLKYEVEGLAAQYGWGVEPMKGIGYREFRPYFQGTQSLAATKRKVVKSTLELAKRQRTWFKRHQEIQWVGSPGEASKLVTAFLAGQ